MTIVFLEKYFNYYISSDGRVYNKNERELYSCIGNSGYKMVNLYLDGKRKNCYIHRLVAEAFLDKTDDVSKCTVDHINRNRLQNDVTNLRWASHKDQAQNTIRVLNKKKYKIIDFGENGCELFYKILDDKKRRRKVFPSKDIAAKWVEENLQDASLVDINYRKK
jgi:hypothetical protein